MKKDNYHLIGIGGIGMSALARVLLDRKAIVTGSDIKMSATVEALAEAGAQISIGHTGDHLSPQSTVIYSSDVKKENLEYERAFSLGCPILHRSDLLSELMRGYQSLAVAGTHGKTTTSSLLAWVLLEAGLDPAFAVGGILRSMQKNGRHGQGDYFVAEADESDGSFLKYEPFGAIVTNVEPEHLNYYGTEKALYDAFDQFIQRAASEDHLFWCGDDLFLSSKQRPGVSYGFQPFNLLLGSAYKQIGFHALFDATFQGKHYAAIEIPLIGQHNASNALAVFGLALKLGIAEEAIRKAFLSFEGVARRSEKKGEMRNVLVMDDYGHHPSEVRATLQGIREAVQERRLIVVFQPHRYSRTQECLELFGTAFDAADELILTDLYSAGEAEIPDINSERVLKEVKKSSTIPSRVVLMSDLIEKLTGFVRPHDVVVTMGAGDVTYMGGRLLQAMRKKPPKKYVVGVVAGGRSSEHEVAINSAKFVLGSLKRDYYLPKAFGVTKQGRWMADTNSFEKLESGEVPEIGPLISSTMWRQMQECDVMIPIFHGPFGEDGMFAGLFEAIGKAYVGCDHRSASICMDKAMTKKVAIEAGIRTLPYIEITQHSWKNSSEQILDKIYQTLPLPVFVKPVHLGSTIGVRKVEIFAALRTAIEEVLKFDRKIIVEKGVVGRELEFAVYGNEIVRAAPPGEILTGGAVYDYESKYSSDGAPTHAVAQLSPELVAEGRELAERMYRQAGCVGLARVDFFLDEDNQYWMNEINPLPGFTATSLYPQIWKAQGLDGEELLDQLIILALERKRFQERYGRV